jgi:hypothetical protein
MSCEGSTLHPPADPQILLIAELIRRGQGEELIPPSLETAPPLKGGGWTP